MNGSPLTGSNDFGVVAVSGRSRVASPPARTAAESMFLLTSSPAQTYLQNQIASGPPAGPPHASPGEVASYSPRKTAGSRRPLPRLPCPPAHRSCAPVHIGHRFPDYSSPASDSSYGANDNASTRQIVASPRPATHRGFRFPVASRSVGWPASRRRYAASAHLDRATVPRRNVYSR